MSQMSAQPKTRASRNLTQLSGHSANRELAGRWQAPNTRGEEIDSKPSIQPDSLERARSGIAQEDDVGFHPVLDQKNRLAIRRVAETCDVLGSEIGNLAPARGRAGGIERLHPQIVHAVLADRVYQRLALRSELRPSGNPRVGIENALRWLPGRRFQIHQQDFVSAGG